MNRSVLRARRAACVILAIITAVCAAFAAMTVGASAGTLIKYDISYKGSYVYLTLTPQKSTNTIYYTTNGKMPTKSSAKYAKKLAAKSEVTVTAVEYNRSGSKVASLKAVIKPKVSAPAITAAQEDGSARITIKCGTSGAKIYYTTDGSSPTQKSKLYSGSFLCSDGVTVKARAYKSGMKASGVAAFKVNAVSPEQQVLDIVNKERTSRGLSKLVMSDKLCRAAALRAKETAVKFDHTRPDGTSCFTVFSEYGITYMAAAENIAAGQRSPEEVMDDWMHSTGHRGNILSDRYGSFGIGIYTDGGTTYWVQLFTN